MRVRVGVIGTGFGRRVVAPVFDATPGCDVVEVVSARDPLAVEQLCRRRDVDLVSIHSPPFCHASDVDLALSRGHHVLCDKPLGLGAVESRRMLDRADEAGVVHLVNFEFRHDPVRRRIRDLVLDGAVGRPEHVSWVHLSSSSRRPLRPHGWLFERDRGGGWLSAWGSHAVDFLRWTFGEIAEAAPAQVRTDVQLRPDRDGEERRGDADDGFTAMLRTTADTTITIDTSFAAAASVPPRLVIAGSEGVLECVAESRLRLLRGDEVEDIHVALPEDDRYLEPMRRWAEVVRDAVHAADHVEPSFADGWACDVVLDLLRGRPSLS